jgi:hypothetical protein
MGRRLGRDVSEREEKGEKQQKSTRSFFQQLPLSCQSGCTYKEMCTNRGRRRLTSTRLPAFSKGIFKYKNHKPRGV